MSNTEGRLATSPSGHLRLGGVLQPIMPEGPMELGESDAGNAKEHTDGAIEPSGTLSAINPNTGKIEWQYRSNYPMLGGVMATAGQSGVCRGI